MKRKRRLSLIVASILMAFLFAGCAQQTPGQKSKLDEIRAGVAGIPLSQEIDVATLDLPACDQAKAQTHWPERSAWMYEVPYDRSAAAMKLWQGCLPFYACSSTARNSLSHFNLAGTRFRIGVAPLRTISSTGVQDELLGVYLPGETTIYIDDGIELNADACQIVLHELTHRFDVNSFGGEESIRVEFKAYWAQVAFTQDMDIVTEPASTLSSTSYYTLNTLYDKILAAYGFSPDPSILNDYPVFPLQQLFAQK